MPRPGYLICSASGAVDEATKLASAFNIVETLHVFPVQPEPNQSVMVNMPPLRIMAHWLRDDQDLPEVEFEVLFSAQFPNSNAERELTRTTFRFAGRTQRVNILGWQAAQLTGGA